ncbi:MAG: Lon protease family protein, partial [Sphaerochaetaceae bacterium]
MDKNEVRPHELEFSYPTDLFSAHRKTASFDDSFIGQPRAMKALMMGMSLFSKNYNIFLSGDPGSGRHEAIRHAASKL